MSISVKTIKRLFAKSSNECAHPECEIELVNDQGTVIGQLCHIEARSAEGPRYNSSLSQSQKDSYDNLILLCANHHKTIDSEIKKYPVDLLKEMRSSHENKSVKKPDRKRTGALIKKFAGPSKQGLFALILWWLKNHPLAIIISLIITSYIAFGSMIEAHEKICNVFPWFLCNQFNNSSSDEHQYETVEVNDLIWINENIQIDIEGSYTYNDDRSNIQRLGRYYTHVDAEKACLKLKDYMPGNWRLPTEEEFKRALMSCKGPSIIASIQNGSCDIQLQLYGARYYKSTPRGPKEWNNNGSWGYYWTSDPQNEDDGTFNSIVLTDRVNFPKFVYHPNADGYNCRCVKFKD